jgi:MFS family permease
MGRAPNIWYLTAFSATFYLWAGMTVTLISILVGLFARETERGRAFGILALTNPLGSLVGGFMAGPIADRWGYTAMFAVLSLFGILWPLTGFLLKDKEVARVQPGETATAEKRPGLGGSFYLLFLASLAAMVASFVSTLGRSLVMNDLGFAATAISSAGAISGAATLPLPPLIGWLSDRVGRKLFLALGYLIGTVGLLVLPASVSLWHFWVASLLLSIFWAVNIGVGPALVTDLVPRESLGRGVSLFSTTTWIGGIIGFAGTGYAVQALGMTATFVVGAFLTLMAILLLIPIRRAR